jgi:hypothetical protein
MDNEAPDVSGVDARKLALEAIATLVNVSGSRPIGFCDPPEFPTR